MSMRKMLTLLLCLMALASVFISCAAEQQTDDLATVRLSINSERSRTINEEGNKVVKYRFEFKDKDGIQYTSEFDKGTGIYTMTGIKAGSYEINSYALNSAGNVVAEKTQNKNILRGINTISVLFDTYNSPEKGNISINVKWNAGDFKKKVDITGTINPLGEDPVGITFPATGESNNGDISTVIENLPVGSYHIKIVGKQGTKSVFGINEVVVVSPNATTVANFDFTGLIASSSITVVNNLVLPLKGELTANLTEDKNRITLNLKVTNSGIPENVYKPGGTMKKVILVLCMIATLVSCGSKNEQWEYKVVKVAGTDAEVMADFGTLVFADQTSMLNKMGKEGWELVSTYTETGTSFPNFGNSEYVTGLRTNTRTVVVNFVFKRISDGKEEVKKPEKKSEQKK